MKSAVLIRCFFAVLLSIVVSAAWAQTPPGQVEVHYKDPQHFTEVTHSFGSHRTDADDYLKPLKAYFIKRAARILAPGQRLDIEVTDVDLAGEYEPWLGPDLRDVRIVKRVYPPRIDLHFTLYGANGQVLREGSRKLRDPAFMSRGMVNDHGALRYEKSLIDLWLRRGVDQL